MRLIFILCLSISVCQAQPNAFHWWFINGASEQSIGSGRLISFVHPNPQSKTWRDSLGVESTGTITIPFPYSSVQWSIIEHETRQSVKTGSGVKVSWAPTYGTGCNLYDLQIIAKRGGRPDIKRILPGEIKVYPRMFTEAEADAVWDLSSALGGKDGGNTDRFNPANPKPYRIFLKGQHTGTAAIQIFAWRSSRADYPIHIMADPATQVQINSTAATLLSIGGEVKNLILDGSTNESRPYGILLNMTDPGSQVMYIYGGGTSVDLGGGNIVCSGIEIAGNDVSGSGITWQSTAGAGSPNPSATMNYDTFTMDRIELFKFYIHDTFDEGMYGGYNNDGLVGGYRHSAFSHGYFHHNTVNHVGNEGFQIGLHHTFDVFCNSFVDTGYRNQSDHRNIFQFSGGCQDFGFFANYCESSKNIVQWQTGATGGNGEVFSNVIHSTGKNDVTGVNLLIRVDENVERSSFYTGIFNNSIYIANGIPFSLYNGAGWSSTVLNPAYFDSNIISTNTATTNEQFDGFVNTNLVINNIQNQDVNDVFYFDASNKDYRMVTVNSPAYSYGRNSTSGTRLHPLANTDYNGYEYLTSTDQQFAGAYAGREVLITPLLTRNITSDQSYTDLTDIANGTSFASLPLPSEGLVSCEDGSTRVLPIVWSQGGYNGSAAGTYALTGTYTLPNDITNSSSITASINVTVLSPLSPLSFRINIGGDATTTLTTSTTSRNLTGLSGSTTWTTQTGASWTTNALTNVVRVYSRANPTVDYADGTVTGYVSGTGVLTVNVTSVSGSGAHTDWDIVLKDWWSTGTTSPNSGNASTSVSYGSIIINGVDTNVDITAVNNGTQSWVTSGGGQSSTNGGSAGTTHYDQCQLSYWFTQDADGGYIDLDGSALNGRTYTVRILPSRTSITATRTTEIAFECFSYGSPATQSATSAGGTGNDTDIVVTGVFPVSNRIRIRVRGVTPNDASPPAGHINTIEIISE